MNKLNERKVELFYISRGNKSLGFLIITEASDFFSFMQELFTLNCNELKNIGEIIFIDIDGVEVSTDQDSFDYIKNDNILNPENETNENNVCFIISTKEKSIDSSDKKDRLIEGNI